MGFPIFEIVLDPEQPVYVAGAAVKGYLRVATNEEIECRSLKVWIKGKAKVKWSKGSGKNRRTYTAVEQYFRQESLLWQGRDSGNRFGAGSRNFPFTFILPSDIPSSFTSPNGSVVYKLKAEADLPLRFDQSTHKMFSVNFMYDLNRDPLAVRPLMMEKEKTVCCLCCADGPIRLTMQAQRSGYVPGESLVVEGEVMNGSFSTIKYTEIKLVQQITHIARSHTHKVTRTVQRVYHPQVPTGGKDVWSSVPLPIPPVPASHLHHCNLIMIDYALVLVAKLGTCRKAKVLAPVIIGTLPLRGTYSTFRTSGPTEVGGTALATSIRRSPSPHHPSALSPIPPHGPFAPSAPFHQPPQAIPSAPPPVPQHGLYTDPPPPYTASLLPDEYADVPPPSYSSCAFSGGARGGDGGGSDESDDEGGFAPRYFTYPTIA
ncbi:arrestin domain-containing protein 3-like [Eriocheir sinensis]|uniref:arrestin domain-containing protein 3-like n=1 Tax=Eriocheir sinensis TaxID=95602 RepID=UPI0021C768EB|nr:arrestin domain-containing protein 3-like [Eriocheir sinensis]XP_050698171.1 arrestin domain-containing protein 3-like [Eriocheir sinensis]XP_050698172.1 arrestin domain-containing protein 3-like [Eriocheir sinensis]XP_050698173.1 arrestin domain-containing protein 3-like [Eriocheir sinensis]